MNCFIWILLLLGCGGNCGNSGSAWNNNCCNNGNTCCNNRNCCMRNEEREGNRNSNCCMMRCMECEERPSCIQPRRMECEERSSCIQPRRDNGNYMSAPPVPGRVFDNDDCGCND